MKKISLILFILIFISMIFIMPCVMAQSPTDEELSEISKDVVLTIFDVGLIKYLKGGIANIVLVILAFVGLGNMIVRFTPTKKDDMWYEKYILKPLRFIGKIISLQSIKDKENINQ